MSAGNLSMANIYTHTSTKARKPVEKSSAGGILNYFTGIIIIIIKP